jgi:hypothetical protein
VSGRIAAARASHRLRSCCCCCCCVLRFFSSELRQRANASIGPDAHKSEIGCAGARRDAGVKGGTTRGEGSTTRGEGGATSGVFVGGGDACRDASPGDGRQTRDRAGRDSPPRSCCCARGGIPIGVADSAHSALARVVRRSAVDGS